MVPNVHELTSFPEIRKSCEVATPIHLFLSKCLAKKNPTQRVEQKRSPVFLTKGLSTKTRSFRFCRCYQSILSLVSTNLGSFPLSGDNQKLLRTLRNPTAFCEYSIVILTKQLLLGRLPEISRSPQITTKFWTTPRHAADVSTNACGHLYNDYSKEQKINIFRRHLDGFATDLSDRGRREEGKLGSRPKYTKHDNTNLKSKRTNESLRTDLPTEVQCYSVQYRKPQTTTPSPPTIKQKYETHPHPS